MMMNFSKRVLLIVFLLVFSASSPAWGGENDIKLAGKTYVQDEFKDLSETIGLLISYKPLAPAEPLGILGFDVGLEVTAVDVKQDSSFLTTVIPDPPSFFIFPKLHIQKGFPFAIDAGIVYAQIPQSNIGMIGGEIKWAILKGTVATPAVAVRGSYTRLTGLSDLDLSTYGLDVSASKGFAFLTPYVGVGQVWIQSEPNVTTPVLTDEELSRTKGFAGLKMKLLLLSFAAEMEFSEVLAYSFRANLSF
jgi:hypothetical protein